MIGSWSFPGWYEKFIADVAADPDRFGPVDREEAVRDAVRLAVDDQLRAGLDRITDGEMQRVDFNLGFYDYLDGLEPLPTARRLGRPGARPARASIAASPRSRRPTGSGVVDEYRRLRDADRRAGQDARARAVHAGRLHRRGRRLRRPQRRDRGPDPDRQRRAEGAASPPGSTSSSSTSRASPATPTSPSASSTSSPGPSRASMPTSACTCASATTGPGRSGWRSYRPLFPHIGRAKVNQLALEFASREMAEVELLAELPETMDVAVGLVDVKNTWIEPPELVAERLRTGPEVRRRRRGSRSRPTAASRRRPGTSRSPRRRRWSRGSGSSASELKPMIEPVRQGVELLDEIERDQPRPRARCASGGWGRAAS